VPSLVADKRETGADHAANEVGLLQGALTDEPATEAPAGDEPATADEPETVGAR
jgi:hypothetical protein